MGYHRAEILGALANGVALVVVSLYVFFEAYRRFGRALARRRSEGP